MKIVAFKLGEEEYGLDISNVQSIERLIPTTRVPNAPEYVKGVINLRGTVMPIIDLQKRLGQGETHYTEDTRIIVSIYEEIELGLLVDRTSDVIDVNLEDVEATASGGIDSAYFEGILKFNGRLIIMLKLENLINQK